jgi:hypothetical protein
MESEVDAPVNLAASQRAAKGLKFAAKGPKSNREMEARQ